MNFPQYRKYPNDKSFFKILSREEFIEVQLIGEKKLESHFAAKTFVDRNFINDMLGCTENRWEVITMEEYQIRAEP